MNEPQGWAPGAPSPARPSSPSSPTLPTEPGPGPQSAPTPLRPKASPPPAPSFDSISLDTALTPRQNRFVAPDLSPGEGRTRIPWLRVASIFAGAVVVGVIAGAAYVAWLRPVPVDDAVIVLPGSSAAEVAYSTPRAVVSDYFDALVAGDIDKALTLGPQGDSGSGALLTHDAYAETRRISPISDVRVHASDADADEVEVTYRVGDTLVDTAVPVITTDGGGYQLARTTVPVSFVLPHDADLPLNINGQRVTPGQRVEVVPGRYVPTTGAPLVDYTPGSALEVRTLADLEIPPAALQPELTDEGRAAFTAAARDSLITCLASGSLTPDGCPMARRSSRSVAPGSVVWKLSGDPLADARPALDADDPTTATVTVDLPMTLSVDYTDGTRTRDQQVTVRAVASAEILGSAADVDVTWSR